MSSPAVARSRHWDSAEPTGVGNQEGFNWPCRPSQIEVKITNSSTRNWRRRRSSEPQSPILGVESRHEESPLRTSPCSPWCPSSHGPRSPSTQTEAIELTTKIEAIDKTARLVTLKNKAGEVETITARPRSAVPTSWKVGDTMTFRYYESIALRDPQAGPAQRAAGRDAPGRSARSGDRSRRDDREAGDRDGDGGKRSDAKVPSVTVLTEDGAP